MTKLNKKQKRSVKRRVDLEQGVRPPVTRVFVSKKIYTRKIKQIGGANNIVCDNNFNIKDYTNNITCNRLADNKTRLALHPDKNRDCEVEANNAFN